MEKTIRSVRAFGTTQSLLFISFTKPSMTTLPSSCSKVKQNGTVKFFETLADNVFRHNYSMMQI
jgi:hypothetical protein